ncbi:DUF5682 family protein [Pseudoalteromonas sp. TB64]|uniref:DUF5682 family protein n=1 Tax=Pseudoalteromonas sp. TB64 TaxID=1938600 RepID=UPI00041A5B48|nr:DUF5682 family protein [Pseudoalteromonas sp. TB64]
MAHSDIHYFGIRHHGPGSSKRLLAALEQLQPQHVLIEGPADCNELLPLLANPQMKPPIALLNYAVEHASNSIFYPFAEYSPEYQACLWATNQQKPVEFIDLPISVRLAQMQIEQDANNDNDSNCDDEITNENEQNTSSNELETSDPQLAALLHDPIGALANIAGYEDAEGWWNDLIEQSRDDSLAIFEQVEHAMTALRQPIADDSPALAQDRLREAFMRLEIAKVAKECDGPIAVICGAWHVPALKGKHTTKDDRALIKTLPKKLAASKYKSTWIPWTSSRLATQAGYGAGVSAPMWYQHLWQHRNQDDHIAPWLVFIANTLREQGAIISTASVIEAQRLSLSLAAVRDRPQPSFEEITDAVISCMCFGEYALWQQINKTVLLGQQVGEIPDDIDLVPLLEDLQKLQKKYRLKPEALEKEHSLDLRSDIGQNKSVLLHRLQLLDVPWGEQLDAGSSRGTFREKWRLIWQPEYAIKLVEHLVYGSTIEQAANNKVIAALAKEQHLGKLATLVNSCLSANLNNATDFGLTQLTARAGQVSDCHDLLTSISPLIDISRYGTARTLALGKIDELIERLTIQAALALPYACRNLNDEETQQYRQNIHAAHRALVLHLNNTDTLAKWWQSIEEITHSSQSNFLLIGLCARLLYQAERLNSEQLSLMLNKMLSPALPPAQAALFFDGFFTDAVDQLLYDSVLLDAINNWLLHLEETTFIEFLPLFRRVFSNLDSMERKRLFDTLFSSKSSSEITHNTDTTHYALWQQQLSQLAKLAQRDKDWLI